VSTHAGQLSLWTSGGFGRTTHDPRGRFRSAGRSRARRLRVCGYPATFVN
jgi:hypothetical protein